MKKWTPLFVFLFTVPALGAWDLSEVMKNIEIAQDRIQTVRFDFNQEVDFLQSDMKSQLSGSALLGHSQKMRITKNLPQEQITISDGKKVWIYTPAYNQVWVGKPRDWETKMGVVPNGLVRLDNFVQDLSENYNVTLGGKSESGRIELRAQPKKGDNPFTLLLHISTQTWLPVQTIYESDSAKVTTVLSNLVVNSKVKDGEFRFDPPAGAEVIPFN